MRRSDGKKHDGRIPGCDRIAALLIWALVFGAVLIPSPYVKGGPLQGYLSGKATDGVYPSLLFDRDTNWNAYVYFTGSAQEQWWLGVVSNSIGCRLRLWETNGMEVGPKSPEVGAARKLAPHANVAYLLDAIRHPHGSGLGMLPYLMILPDAVMQVYTFHLGTLFPVDPSREYILEVAPMLYKVNIANGKRPALPSQEALLTAGLVHFSPIYIKLLTNGTVVSVEGPPQNQK